MVERGTKIAASLAIVAAAVYGWWQYEDSKKSVRVDRSRDFLEKYETRQMTENKRKINSYVENGESLSSAIDALLISAEFFDEAYSCVKFGYCDEETMSNTLGEHAKTFWGHANDVVDRVAEDHPLVFETLKVLENITLPTPVGDVTLTNSLNSWLLSGMMGRGVECIKDEFYCEDYMSPLQKR